MNTLNTQQTTPRHVRRNASRKQATKPEVRIVEMSDGSIRIINVGKAARFCGVNQQTFSAILHRHYKAKRQHSKTSPIVSAAERVRATYPELFS